MTINDKKTYRIYLKTRKQWIEVSEEFYRDHNRHYDAIRKCEQYHGRCACPKNKFWLCDGDCGNCEFRRAGDTLSLDYESENGNGDTYSMINSIADSSPSMEKVVEDRLLLNDLLKRLCELDPDGELIWQMLENGSSDRSIAKALGRPQRTFSRQMQHYRDEFRKIRGF